MHIVLNGEPLELADAASVADLLRQLDIAQRRVAVEVNRSIVPRSQHEQHRLLEGDAVELVQAMGGG